MLLTTSLFYLAKTLQQYQTGKIEEKLPENNYTSATWRWAARFKKIMPTFPTNFDRTHHTGIGFSYNRNIGILIYPYCK